MDGIKGKTKNLTYLMMMKQKKSAKSFKDINAFYKTRRQTQRTVLLYQYLD